MKINKDVYWGVRWVCVRWGTYTRQRGFARPSPTNLHYVHNVNSDRSATSAGDLGPNAPNQASRIAQEPSGSHPGGQSACSHTRPSSPRRLFAAAAPWRDATQIASYLGHQANGGPWDAGIRRGAPPLNRIRSRYQRALSGRAKIWAAVSTTGPSQIPQRRTRRTTTGLHFAHLAATIRHHEISPQERPSVTGAGHSGRFGTWAGRGICLALTLSTDPGEKRPYRGWRSPPFHFRKRALGPLSRRAGSQKTPLGQFT